MMRYGTGWARIVQLNVYGEFTASAPSTREHMHTEEYRKFNYTATYTALHIYMKTQSRGTHPCVLFTWLSKACSIFTSVYLYGCRRSVEEICMQKYIYLEYAALCT